MKKILLFFSAIAIVSCSSDDDSSTENNSTSFRYDGTAFQLQPSMGISEIIMPRVTESNGQFYDRSTISLTGLNGMTSTATVSFDLYYKTGTSVGGTYIIHDTEVSNAIDFDEFLAIDGRASLGWTSAGVIFSMGSGSMTSGNNPTGSVQIIVNSPTNYTVKYIGNFREYNGDFEVVRNLPAEINVTGDITRE